MPNYSQRSLNNLNSCDQRLQELFFACINYFDCTIIQGHRGEKDQNRFFYNNRSKVKWPNSKHNRAPSLAVDVAPYISGRGIPWPNAIDLTNNKNKYIKDIAHFYYFAGFVLATANSLDIDVTWGGDWDRDNDLHDQSFDDLVHWELNL